MSRGFDRAFDAAARERVAKAVSAAEAGTSGEVVVAVERASDDYPEASARAAAAAVGLAALAEILAHRLTPSWSEAPSDWALGALTAGIGALCLARWVSPLTRLLVGRGRLESRARAAALAAFRELRVGETRDRTGILIYVSLLERHVVVLPDTGIAARAPEPTWKGVVECIVGGMKAGAPGDGLVAAVGLCGDTLRAAGFAPRPDDTNELPDAGRFGSR